MSENCNECEQACQECNPCPENCGPIIETCPEPPYTSENCENSVNTRCITYDAGDEPCIENIENNSNFNIVLTKIFTYLKSIWTRLIPSDASISITPIDDSCDNKANIKVNISEDEGNVIEVRDDGLFATGGAFSETSITPNNLNKSVILSATGTSNHTLSGDVLKDTVTGGGNNILSVGVNGVYVPPYPGTNDVLCSDLTSVISELLDANQNNTVNSTTYDLVSFKSSIVSNCKLELISPPTGFAITGSSRVSSFGKMEWYSTLTAANNAAGSGETVLIFNDTTESLTIKANVNYQGVGFKSIGGVGAINVGVVSLSNLKITDVVSYSGTGTIYCSNVLCTGNVSVGGNVFINGLNVKNELATVTIFDSASVSNFNADCKVTVTGSASLDKASIVNTNPSAPVFTPGILSVGSVLNGTVKLNNLKVKSVTSVAGYLISTNGTQNGRIVASNCDFEANLSTALYAHCGNSQDGTDNGSGTPTTYASNSVYLSHITARNIGTPNPSNTFGNAAVNLAGAAAHAPAPPYSPNYIGGTTTNGLATHITAFSIDGSGIVAQGWGIKNSYGYSLNSSGISNDSEEFQNYKLELINCIAESSNYHGAELLRDVYIVGGTYITRSSNSIHSPIAIGDDSFPSNNYYITNITTITRNTTAYAIRGLNVVTAKIFNNNWLNEYISPGTPVPGVYHTGIGGNITMATVPAADSFGNRG